MLIGIYEYKIFQEFFYGGSPKKQLLKHSHNLKQLLPAIWILSPNSGAMLQQQWVCRKYGMPLWWEGLLRGEVWKSNKRV